MTLNYLKYLVQEVNQLIIYDIIRRRRNKYAYSFLAYGKVFLVRKMTGGDIGKLYAMKVLKKAAILQKAKTAEHIKTERQVLESIRQIPFLVSLHYAFQSDAKLHLVMGLFIFII